MKIMKIKTTCIILFMLATATIAISHDALHSTSTLPGHNMREDFFSSSYDVLILPLDQQSKVRNELSTYVDSILMGNSTIVDRNFKIKKDVFRLAYTSFHNWIPDVFEGDKNKKLIADALRKKIEFCSLIISSVLTSNRIVSTDKHGGTTTCYTPVNSQKKNNQIGINFLKTYIETLGEHGYRYWYNVNQRTIKKITKLDEVQAQLVEKVLYEMLNSFPPKEQPDATLQKP